MAGFFALLSDRVRVDIHKHALKARLVGDGSLSTRSFETRTATGSDQFSLLTWPHTATLLIIFSPLEMSSTKIWETMLSWHAKCSLPVAVRASKSSLLGTAERRMLSCLLG